MSKKKIALFLFAALVAILGALVLNMRWNNRSLETEHASRDIASVSGENGPQTNPRPQGGTPSQQATGNGTKGQTQNESTSVDEESSETGNEEEDPIEKIVNEFDDYSDKWNEPGAREVTMSDIDEFKRRFSRVPADRKGECLQRSLNLLPDENVMLLVGVLLDKTMDKEYIEMVFNDVLNRDEDVKKPILAELYKDREHPCWADTAWILDVTGETPGAQKAQADK